MGAQGLLYYSPKSPKNPNRPGLAGDQESDLREVQAHKEHIRIYNKLNMNLERQH